MALHFLTTDIDFKPENPGKIKSWISSVINKESKLLGTVSFIFSSDEYLLALNRKYLEKDYYTDVISFDYSLGDTVSGDIFISIERVKDNALEYNVHFNDELHRVLLHGILHLSGYNDTTEIEKKLMKDKEDIYLAQR